MVKMHIHNVHKMYTVVPVYLHVLDTLASQFIHTSHQLSTANKYIQIK